MSSLKIWIRVPDKTDLELWVESADDKWVSGARLIDDQGNEQQWSDTDLHPGPATKRIRSPRSWTARVAVSFTGKATATIRARLVKQNGDVHGKPYAYKVSGNSGDVGRATIIAITS